EPPPLKPDDPFICYSKVNIQDTSRPQEDSRERFNKRWSLLTKNEDLMSKQELVNCFRLLMNDHMRLERFISIMSKDSEMLPGRDDRLSSQLMDTSLLAGCALTHSVHTGIARAQAIFVYKYPSDGGVY
ncbi:unnamed protein product, partial [Protopolystoma xenopodis]